jgi:outer membrane protein assembly factor BamB
MLLCLCLCSLLVPRRGTCEKTAAPDWPPGQETEPSRQPSPEEEGGKDKRVLVSPDGEDTKEESEDAVFLDTNAELRKLLEEVASPTADADWRKRIPLLVRLLENHHDSLGPKKSDPNVFVPMPFSVAEQIFSLPSEGVQNYQDTYGAAAKFAYEAFHEGRKREDLTTVVDKFLSSSVGSGAADMLAEFLFEGGRTAEAAFVWKEILEVFPRALYHRAGILTKIALSYLVLGREAEYERICLELSREHPSEKVSFGGKTLTVTEFLREQARHNVRGVSDVGNPPDSDARYRPRASDKLFNGRKAWDYDLGERFVPQTERRLFQERGERIPLLSRPEILSERVAASHLRGLVLLDRRSGETKWEVNEPDIEPKRHDQLQDTLESPAVSGGVLGVKLAQRLRAYDWQSGEVVWDSVDARASTADTEFFKELQYFTSPAGTEKDFVVAATREKGEVESLLAAFDRRTGRLAWKALLAARSKERLLGLGDRPSRPLCVNSEVYCCTNIGVVGAINAQSGKIRWVRKYESFLPKMKIRTVRDQRRWENSAPLYDQGLLYVAPQDSNLLYALDVVDGRVVWQVERAENARVHGLNSDVILMSGKGLQAVDKRNGSVVWERQNLRYPVTGQGWLNESEVLLPTENGLWRLRAANGEELGFYSVTDMPSPAGIIVDRGQLLVYSPFRILCFEQWPTPAGDGVAATPSLSSTSPAQATEPLVPWELRTDSASRGEADTRVPEEGTLDRIRGVLCSATTEERGRSAAVGNMAEAVRFQRRCASLSARAEEAISLLLSAASQAESTGKAREAVAIYQQLLQSYGSEFHEFEPAVFLPVGAYAKRKIKGILQQSGTEPYESVEREAQSLVEQARGGDDGALLASIARNYPNSRAAATALYEQAMSDFREEAYDRAQEFLETLFDEHSGDKETAAKAALLEAAIACRQGNTAAAKKKLDDLALTHGGGLQQLGEEAASLLKDTEQRLKEQAEKAGQGGGTAQEERAGLRLPLRHAWQTYARMDTDIAKFPEVWTSEPGTPSDRFFLLSRSGLGRRGISFGARQQYEGLSCHDVRSGAELWSRLFPEGLWETGSLGLSGNVLVAVSGLRAVGLQPASGEALWVFSPGGDAAAKRAEDKAGADPEDEGDLLRRKPQIEPYRLSGAAFTKKNVFISTLGGALHCLDSETGAAVWDKRVDERTPYPPHLIDDTRVLVVTESPIRAYVLDRGDGSLLFMREFKEKEGRLQFAPRWVRGADVLLLPLASQELKAYHLGKNRFLWEKQIAFDFRELLVLEKAGLVGPVPAAWGHFGQLTLLDAATGEEKWRDRNVKKRLRKAIPAEDRLFIVRTEYPEVRVQAYEVPSFRELWDAPIPRSNELKVLCAGQQVLISSDRPPGAEIRDGATGNPLQQFEFPRRNTLDMALCGNVVCFATDRGMFGYEHLSEHRLADELLDGAEALREARGNAEYVSRMAALYFKAGRTDCAALLLAQALDLEQRPDPEFRLLHDQLTGILEYEAQTRKPRLTLHKFQSKPEIDGELSDGWREEQSQRLTDTRHIGRIQQGSPELRFWRGRNDLSARLYLGWDDEHLYMAVDVTDDIPHAFSSESPTWKGDGLTIAIDPELDGGVGFGAMVRDYVFTQALMNKQPDKKDEDDNEPEGQYAVRRKPDGTGTIYESAIPWSYISRISPVPGTRFGFNIYVTDDDTGDGAEKGVTWTSGIQLHRNRGYFEKGYVPDSFAEIELSE